MALRPHSCCTQCPAFKVSPWTHLPEGDLEVLTQGNEPFEAAPGEAPTLRAPSRIGAVCVRDGTLAVWRVDSSAEPALIRLVEAGELAVDPAAGHDADVRLEATTHARGCVLDAQAVAQAVRRSPETLNTLYARQAQRLSTAERRQRDLASLPVAVRLARALLDLREAHGVVTDDGVLHLTLPMNRKQLASLISARPETLSRAFEALAAAHVAYAHARKVKVDDIDVLMDFARLA